MIISRERVSSTSPDFQIEKFIFLHVQHPPSATFMYFAKGTSMQRSTPHLSLINSTSRPCAHSLLSQSSLTQKNKRTNPLLDPSFHKYGEQLKPISRLQRSSLQQPLLSVPLQLPFLQQVLLLEPQLPELPFSRPNGYDESWVSQQPSPLSYRFH